MVFEVILKIKISDSSKYYKASKMLCTSLQRCAARAVVRGDFTPARRVSRGGGRRVVAARAIDRARPRHAYVTTTRACCGAGSR